MNILDCIGEPCPLPLLKVEKALNSMKKGEVISVEVDHTCAMTNVPEMARKLGHDVKIKEVSFGEWEIIITKR